MSIRLIAVDLDGTLLNSNLEISPANRRALAAASEQGVRIAIITGRRYHSAKPLVDTLPCPVTMVTSNGAIIRRLDGKVLHRNFLPHDVAVQVLEAAIDYRPYAVAIFDKADRGQVMMQQNASHDGPLRWYLKTAREYLLQVQDLPTALPEDPIQVMFGGAPAFLVPIGISAGVSSTLLTALWVELYGADRLAEVRARIEGANVLASGTSPIVMGYLIDLGVPLSAQAAICLFYVLATSLLARRVAVYAQPVSVES